MKKNIRTLGAISTISGLFWVIFFVEKIIAYQNPGVLYFYMFPTYQLILEIIVGLLGIIGGIHLILILPLKSFNYYKIMVFVSTVIPLIGSVYGEIELIFLGYGLLVGLIRFGIGYFFMNLIHSFILPKEQPTKN